MPPQEGVGFHNQEGLTPGAGEADEDHEDEPVLAAEAWPRWGCPSEHEDLLPEQRILGHQCRAGPNSVEAGGAGERCRGASGPQQVFDALPNPTGAAPDADGHGLDETAQHAISSRVGAWAIAAVGRLRAYGAVNKRWPLSARALLSRVDEASSQHGRLRARSGPSRRRGARGWSAARARWPADVHGGRRRARLSLDRVGSRSVRRPAARVTGNRPVRRDGTRRTDGSRAVVGHRRDHRPRPASSRHHATRHHHRDIGG